MDPATLRELFCSKTTGPLLGLTLRDPDRYASNPSAEYVLYTHTLELALAGSCNVHYQQEG